LSYSYNRPRESPASDVGRRPRGTSRVLRDLDVPEKVVKSFTKDEPAEAMEYGPCIYPIRKIEDLCYDGSTGEAAFDAGLIPFGDLICGDALCFDSDDLDDDGWPAIVRVSHETVWKSQRRKR
jgi:hypothetical protein